MTPIAQFKVVEKRFLITIVSLVVLSVAGLGLLLYETNTISFNSDISSNQLNTLVSNDPAVTDYLEQEKDYEAHFITIANLVKEDQKNSLGRALIFITIPVVALSGLVGVLVARYLLRPVKESYDSQERFIQDAAHELRNPLAAMSVAIQGAPSKITGSDFYQTINRQTKRLVNITEDLLFLEKRKRGEKIIDVNISELLYDVLEDLQPNIIEKDIKLTTSIQKNVTKTMDPLDFVKLSKNLISNAIKYSKTKGEIKVNLKNDSGSILFTVKDKGIGIPKEEIKNIGERFYRAKNVGKASGTGLGISIVQKVLNSYGGKLDINSKINHGTTVIVKL